MCWVVAIQIVRAAAAELPVISPADAGFTATQWTVEDGLPIQTVTALAQTPDGFLWCGTSDGLARFDGLNFKIFFPHEVRELEGFQITALHSDGRGRLWIVDAGGKLAVYERETFRRYSPLDGVPENQVAEIREDNSGNIWLRGRSDGNFYRFRTNRFEPVRLPVPGSELSGFTVRLNHPAWGVRERDGALIRFTRTGIEEHQLPERDGEIEKPGNFFHLPDGTLAATARRGIFACEGTNWMLRHEFNPPIQVTPLDGVQDREEHFWVGTAGGGLVLSQKSGRTGRMKLPGESSGAAVKCLIYGREGNIWAGGNAGLFRLARNSIQTWTGGTNLLRESVQSIAADTNHRIWVIHENRLYWFDPKTNGLSRVALGGEDRVPQRLATARAGGVWVGAGSRRGRNAEIWHLTPTESKVAGKVSGGNLEDLHETSAGELFIATAGGLFARVNGAFEKIALTGEANDHVVTSVAEDAGGRIYAAVSGVGLFRRESGTWRRLTQRADTGSDRIQAMIFDAQGVLWIAADNPCLARWKDDRWFAFSGLENRLPRKARSLVADDEGGLWLSSRWGLVRASRLELNELAGAGAGEISSAWFDRDDGMSSIDCAVGRSGMVRDQSGRVWVGTTRGVCVIDPKPWNEQRLMRVPPTVCIEQVTVDDSVVAATPRNGKRAGERWPRFVVPAGSRRVEIRFTGVNLTSAEKMRFRHRLEGFDNTWVNVAGPRRVHFTKLPPGDYRFQLAAVSNEGVWNHEGASVILTVEPEWWKRAPVRAAAVAGIAGLLWLGGYAQLRRIRHRRAMQSEFSRQLIHSQEQERKRIAGELHDSLGQNLLVAKNLALTGVNGSPNRPETAKLFGDISEVVSTALNEARSISKALRPPEIDRMGLSKALTGMIQRAGESAGIECSVNVDDIDGLLSADDAINLYRMVQEGMNNIVKHARARRAEIEVVHHPDHLAVRIADSGCGFDVGRARAANSPHAGTGLAGMEERTRLVGGEFEIFSQPGKGAAIKIRIPVKTPPP